MDPYENIDQLPPDPIFGLTADFKADSRGDKATFITGYFRDENLITPVLGAVAAAETILAEKKVCREYLPIDGDQEFAKEVGGLVFGGRYDPKRTYAAQSVGGTGALFAVGRLCSLFTDQIAISDPTWANHWKIFTDAGLKALPYPYLANGRLNFEGVVKFFEGLSEHTAVLIHTNCHNPSGEDLSHAQWHELATLVEEKKLFPILDMAYQGFATTLDDDAYGARYFLDFGLPFALTYTCAKNFSIYSERAGALFVIDPTGSKLQPIQSQIRSTMRGIYSNPPIHGAAIVKTVLQDQELKKMWLQELGQMRERMSSVRADFSRILLEMDPSYGWERIKPGKGLFCMSGLSREAVKTLREEKGIYLAADGRINLTGLNHGNLERVASGLISVR